MTTARRYNVSITAGTTETMRRPFSENRIFFVELFGAALRHFCLCVMFLLCQFVSIVRFLKSERGNTNSPCSLSLRALFGGPMRPLQPRGLHGVLYFEQINYFFCPDLLSIIFHFSSHCARQTDPIISIQCHPHLDPKVIQRSHQFIMKFYCKLYFVFVFFACSVCVFVTRHCFLSSEIEKANKFNFVFRRFGIEHDKWEKNIISSFFLSRPQ